MQAGEPINRLLTAAIARHEAGQFAEAEALYAEVLRQDPRQADALNLKAVLAAQAGQTDDALALIHAAIVERPENHHFRFNHGHILDLAGSPSAAAAYREALTINPQHVPALINLANLLLGSEPAGAAAPNRIAEAIDCFNRAISVDRSIPQAHEGLGRALQRRKDPVGALAAFEQALGLDPRSLEANANAGVLLLELDRPREAVVRLGRALELAPERADLRVNLGIALQAAGDLEAAIAALRRALELDPAGTRAIAMLGLFLAQSGDEAGAGAVFDHTRRLRVRQLGIVPGFPDLASFNTALAARIRSHPSLTPSPGGARSGELSQDQDPAIQTLVATIEAEVEAYFAALEALGGPQNAAPDSGTPGAAFDPIRPAHYRLRLSATLANPRDADETEIGGELHGEATPGNRESPRIHPAARLSGRYTLRAPRSPSNTGRESSATEAPAGALLFGETPARFGPSALPRRTVPPLPGQLLLFPSYFWHGIGTGGDAPDSIAVQFQVIPEP